jgi:hypothetical protein
LQTNKCTVKFTSAQCTGIGPEKPEKIAVHITTRKWTRRRPTGENVLVYEYSIGYVYDFQTEPEVRLVGPEAVQALRVGHPFEGAVDLDPDQAEDARHHHQQPL